MLDCSGVMLPLFELDLQEFSPKQLFTFSAFKKGKPCQICEVICKHRTSEMSEPSWMWQFLRAEHIGLLGTFPRNKHIPTPKVGPWRWLSFCQGIFFCIYMLISWRVPLSTSSIKKAMIFFLLINLGRCFKRTNLGGTSTQTLSNLFVLVILWSISAW